MDKPDKIWAWTFMGSKQNEVMKGGWDDKPDRKSDAYLLSTPERELASELVKELKRIQYVVENQKNGRRYSDTAAGCRLALDDVELAASAVLAKLEKSND